MHCCAPSPSVPLTDVNWELDRKSLTLRNQLGIGEFGPIYDAELQLGINMMSRAVVKVCMHMCMCNTCACAYMCMYIITYMYTVHSIQPTG